MTLHLITETYAERLVDSFYLPVGTHTLRARLGPVQGAGTVTLRVRLAGDDTDVGTLANDTAQITTDTLDVVVASAGWYDLFGEITTGVGEAAFDWIMDVIAGVAAASVVVSVGGASAAGTSIFDVNPAVNDIGNPVQITVEEDGVAMDISAASSTTFRFFPPGANASFDRSASFATDGTDGRLTYAVVDGDLSVAGRWEVLAIVVGGWGTRYSDRRSFHVDP